MSNWFQLTIQCDQGQVELLSDQLFLSGAASVTWRDAADTPIFEPSPGTTPLWQMTLVTALFFTDKDMQAAIRFLNQQYVDPALSYSTESLADQDWLEKWKAYFKPICFANRFWVYPSWQPVATHDQPYLLLEPGLAFGTGTHPTTALCLEWLAEQDLTNKSVIDYGCGSGILAIAASILGAKPVLATDIDGQALTATKNNAKQNQLNDNAVQCFFPEDLPTQPVDILLANILANPLLSLNHTFAQLVNPRGQLVLSGILHQQVAAIKQAYSSAFTLQTHRQMDDWDLLVFTRQD